MISGGTGRYDLSGLKVAIVHEWFVDYSGSERVLEQILEIFPQADLYALVEFLPDELRSIIKHKKVRTSFIQKLPGSKRRYRTYLPLMPLAVEQFDLSAYDLVISNNHAVAKGVITGPDQVHISYVHSPMRYAWDLTHQYLSESNLTSGIKGWMAKLILHYLRIWETRSANGVDEFVCNSDFIARRIWKVYRRKASVIYPPVDTGAFDIQVKKDDFYLTVSRMVPYKKIGLIVKAFAKMPDKKLVVIGDGPQYEQIRGEATNNVTFLGYQPQPVLIDYMKRAKAFIFAAEEDFGIVPVEAQACGTPVIAYRKGGVTETVIENETGLFFDRQKPEAIIEAVERFEKYGLFNPERIRENALKFSVDKFRRGFRFFVEEVLSSRGMLAQKPEKRRPTMPEEILEGMVQKEAEAVL